MNIKLLAIVSFVGVAGTMFAPKMSADEWNKKTIITINEPIQVPNKVLEPGKYVLRLLDSPSDRHIVQIFDENEQHLITTVLAIPNYRLQPTGDTRIGFWETPAGQPKAIRSWFYPGDNFGQEFAYPKTMATQIATMTQQVVPTTMATSNEDMRSTTLESVKPEAPVVAQAAPAEWMPAPTPAATPAPAMTQEADRAAAPAQEPASLPKTASPLPMLALLGIFSLLGFGALSLLSRRSA